MKGDALQYAKRALDRSTIGVMNGRYITLPDKSDANQPSACDASPTSRAACGYYPYKRKPTAAPISSWTVRSDLITPWPKTRALMVWSPQPSRRNERAEASRAAMNASNEARPSRFGLSLSMSDAVMDAVWFGTLRNETCFPARFTEMLWRGPCRNASFGARV